MAVTQDSGTNLKKETTATTPRVEVTHISHESHPTPTNHFEKKPRITVIGVGGAGCNAVNNMIRSQLEGVDFVVMNTDAQALEQSLCDKKVHLGDQLTQGLGAGSSPDIGRGAAEESHEQISKIIRNSNMVFIAAGMGGGTGTGSTPVIARAARDLGILTVGVVTKPFHFEGAHRMRTAEKGIEELQKSVDTLIIIPNQNLFRIANENTTFADAFKMADDVLYAGVRSITDLMIMPGLINLDFADVRTIMNEMGKAMMGTGEAEGEGRAIAAAEAAIANPLLDDVSMRGATGVLISITGGMDMTLFEVDEAANRIREEVENDANIIFGSTFDDRLNGRVRVSVVATGINLGDSARKSSTTSDTHNRTSPISSHKQSEATIPQEQQQEPSLPRRPILNLTSDDENTAREPLSLSEDASHQEAFGELENEDDFLDATDDKNMLPPLAHEHDEMLKPAQFESDTSEELLLHDDQTPQQQETKTNPHQMEILFDTPASKKAPSSKSSSPLSTGNFLSRFLKGKNKSQTTSRDVSRNDLSARANVTHTLPDSKKDHFEDELDIPTFMRKQR